MPLPLLQFCRNERQKRQKMTHERKVTGIADHLCSIIIVYGVSRVHSHDTIIHIVIIVLLCNVRVGVDLIFCRKIGGQQSLFRAQQSSEYFIFLSDRNYYETILSDLRVKVLYSKNLNIRNILITSYIRISCV